MTVKNEELLKAIHDLAIQHRDAFSSMDSRVMLIENGILTIHKDLSKVNIKVDGLITQSIISTKDIDFLKENFEKLEKSVNCGFDAVWNEGIRSLRTHQEASAQQLKEDLLSTVIDKIDRRALRERIVIYGTAIAAIFAVVKVLK